MNKSFSRFHITPEFFRSVIFKCDRKPFFGNFLVLQFGPSIWPIDFQWMQFVGILIVPF